MWRQNVLKNYKIFLFVFKDRLVFFNYLCEKDLLLQFSGMKIHTIHNPIVIKAQVLIINYLQDPVIYI